MLTTHGEHLRASEAELLMYGRLLHVLKGTPARHELPDHQTTVWYAVVPPLSSRHCLCVCVWGGGEIVGSVVLWRS